MTYTLPILTFHDLSDDRSNISFPPELFALAVRQMHDAGWEIVSLEEGVARLGQGGPDARPAVVLTFDDGYRSVYQEAFPLLQAYGGTATIFLTTGLDATDDERLPRMYDREMLSWDEVRQMLAAGMSIGSHTCTHPDLTRLADAEIEAELARSRQLIEQALGVTVGCFAYPYGAADRRVRGIVARNARLAVSTELAQAAPEDDPWLLPRVDMVYFRHPRLIPALVSERLDWYLGVRRGPRRVRQWFLRRLLRVSA